MRKITKQACEAFVNGESFKSGNTMVVSDEAGAKMFLHGNLIAELDRMDSNNVLTLSSCGWETNTTKERLNGLLAQYELGYVKQTKGIWYYVREDGLIEPFEDGMEIKL